MIAEIIMGIFLTLLFLCLVGGAYFIGQEIIKWLKARKKQ